MRRLKHIFAVLAVVFFILAAGAFVYAGIEKAEPWFPQSSHQLFQAGVDNTAH